MSTSRALTACVALLLAGCDAAAPPDAAAPSTQTFTTARDGQFDLRFQPLPWEPGDEIAVEAGPTRVLSTARLSGRHTVTWASRSGTVSRVLGLLDGRVQAAFSPGASSGGAGETHVGPTSIHKHTVCHGANCSEVLEYDYDLTDPSGDGTTEWTSPEGSPVTVDRLRFEVSGPVGSSTLAVTTPAPLQISN